MKLLRSYLYDFIITLREPLSTYNLSLNLHKGIVIIIQQCVKLTE